MTNINPGYEHPGNRKCNFNKLKRILPFQMISRIHISHHNVLRIFYIGPCGRYENFFFALRKISMNIKIYINDYLESNISLSVERLFGASPDAVI